MEAALREKFEDDVPGFRNNDSFSLALTLADQRIDVHIEGDGELDLFLISPDFHFTVDFPLRLRTQPAVWRERCGKPADASGAALPADLTCVGLDLENNDIRATVRENNPLLFLGYLDPRDSSFNPVLPLQPTGPWTLANEDGCAIGSAEPPDPETSPPAFHWIETDFAVPPFCIGDFCNGVRRSLRPGLEIAQVPPAKDEVRVDPDFDWLFHLVLGLLAGPLLALDPLMVALSGPALIDMLAFDAFYPGLRAGVAGATPLQPNKVSGWQVFLQHSDSVLISNDAITMSSGGLCLRFRAIPGPVPSLGNWAPAVCQELLGS
jgi:hypothetical protein